LENRDLDTGKPTKAGEYKLTDEAYAKLLDKLAEKKFASVDPTIQTNILAFFSDPDAGKNLVKKPKDWEKTEKQVAELKAQPQQGMNFLK
jgi:hypothetical protein